ncbi:hypothetical protein AWB69_03494 [Caballeronia udeis]|uniref:Uncharacterized protein n=1 Tax=Caballeronia udeis TaxID=1232866 RepID=A0A158GWC7_9BURK|nr:hypothetical protein AWB69_03494 [Caballeronia udeis]
MPQIDHRIGERLERVVQVAQTLEAQQQAAELVFPGEDALDGAEAFIENGRVEKRLATALRVSRPRGLGLMLGFMPRLKMALRLARQS